MKPYSVPHLCLSLDALCAITIHYHWHYNAVLIILLYFIVGCPGRYSDR